MPHITFTNANFGQEREKLKQLNLALSEAVDSPADWFTFTFLPDNTRTFQLDREITHNIIFVEIKWFPRPDEMKERVASLIVDYLKYYNMQGREIVITFTNLDKSSYFEF